METETAPLMAESDVKAPTTHPFFADLPIRKACMYLEDKDAFYITTMPAVLAQFVQLTPDAYWNLTVAEHAEMVGRSVQP